MAKIERQGTLVVNTGEGGRRPILENLEQVFGANRAQQLYDKTKVGGRPAVQVSAVDPSMRDEFRQAALNGGSSTPPLGQLLSGAGLAVLAAIAFLATLFFAGGD